MKKVFLTIVLLFATVNVLLADDSGTCGPELRWKYDGAAHKLIITGSGAMSDFVKCDYAPWGAYTKDITSVSLPNGLTRIGDYAFCGCVQLTHVDIPNTVVSIGSCAFAVCKSIKNIKIPNSVTSIGSNAFVACASIKRIEIPNSVTTIAEAAFYGCLDLTSVTIPSSVTTIGDNAFEECDHPK